MSSTPLERVKTEYSYYPNDIIIRVSTNLGKQTQIPKHINFGSGLSKKNRIRTDVLDI